jgi:hypothetical protein
MQNKNKGDRSDRCDACKVACAKRVAWQSTVNGVLCLCLCFVIVLCAVRAEQTDTYLGGVVGSRVRVRVRLVAHLRRTTRGTVLSNKARAEDGVFMTRLPQTDDERRTASSAMS